MHNKYELDGKTYIYTGKKWLDGRFLEVPLEISGRLNALLKKDIDFESLSVSELKELADNAKKGGNYMLAVNAYEFLMDSADIQTIKSILPSLLSCCRKGNFSDEAVETAEHYLEIYGNLIESPYLFTTLSAACCDEEDYIKARKYADLAQKKNGGRVTDELKNVLGRIEKQAAGTDMGVPGEEAGSDFSVKPQNAGNSGRGGDDISDSEARGKTGYETDNMGQVKSFADSEEREALNRIWKAIPRELRTERYEDFDLICKYIKNHMEQQPVQPVRPVPRASAEDSFRYIRPLTEPARKFFFQVLDEHKLNLYHSAMAVLANSHSDLSEMVPSYLAKNRFKRPYLQGHEKEITEIFQLCYGNLVCKGKMV